MATIILTAAPALAVPSNNGDDNPGDNITFCHATSSKTNPFVQVTANANGIVSGHAGHQDENDIIPPFDYNDNGTTKHFDGLNWDTQGQAIFNNGCKAGGQGGGSTETTTTGQVAANPTQTAGAGGQAAPQAVAAQGGVAAGAGGAKVTSAGAIAGLIASVGTFASGLVFALRKF